MPTNRPRSSASAPPRGLNSIGSSPPELDDLQPTNALRGLETARPVGPHDGPAPRICRSGKGFWRRPRRLAAGDRAQPRSWPTRRDATPRAATTSSTPSPSTASADAAFALPDFGPGATFPGAVAMDFHFIDYVVHGWDVAAPWASPTRCPPTSSAPPCRWRCSCPTATSGQATAHRSVLRSSRGHGDDLGRILRHLGRRPEWNQDVLDGDGRVVGPAQRVGLGPLDAGGDAPGPPVRRWPADSRCASPHRCRTPCPATTTSCTGPATSGCMHPHHVDPARRQQIREPLPLVR